MPVVRSVNCTVKGTTPLVGVPEKLATRGGIGVGVGVAVGEAVAVGVGVADTVIVFCADELPPSFVTVNVTV